MNERISDTHPDFGRFLKWLLQTGFTQDKLHQAIQSPGDFQAEFDRFLAAKPTTEIVVAIPLPSPRAGLQIALPDQNTDIDIQFPGGQVITFKYEGGTMHFDVLLPEALPVSNYGHADFDPAASMKIGGDEAAHVRLAKELTIDVKSNYLSRP